MAFQTPQAHWHCQRQFTRPPQCTLGGEASHIHAASTVFTADARDTIATPRASSGMVLPSLTPLFMVTTACTFTIVTIIALKRFISSLCCMCHLHASCCHLLSSFSRWTTAIVPWNHSFFCTFIFIFMAVIMKLDEKPSIFPFLLTSSNVLF